MTDSATSPTHRQVGVDSEVVSYRNALPSWPASGGIPADDITIGPIGQLLGALPLEARPAVEAFLDQLEDSARDVVGLARDASRRDLPASLDSLLNFNEGGLASLPSTLADMSREEAEAFLQSLAKLLRHGVVGYEVRKVNGIPRKMFISAAIGSDFHRAPLIRSSGINTLV